MQQQAHAALLAQIYATPDDDSPRLVYADALTEAGDPRGELIALQCSMARRAATREEKRREKELLAAHGAAWCGKLVETGAARPAGVVFRRGFVAEVTVRDEQQLYQVGSRDPIWLTVESLTFSTRNLSGRVAFLDVTHLPVLRAVRRLRGSEARWLSEGLPRPYITVGVDSTNDWYTDTVDKIAVGPGLPRVRRLELAGNMFAPDEDLPRALVGARFDEVVADSTFGWHIELLRDGRVWRLAATEQKHRHDPYQLVRLLLRLPPETLVAIRINHLGAGRPLDELRAAATRFPSLESCEIG